MFDSSNVYQGDSETFEQDGFTITARIELDDAPDLSYLGEFSDSPDDGAIDHHETGEWLQRSWQGERYFNPCHYAIDYYLGEEKLSPKEAKEKADAQAQTDYKRLKTYWQDEWSMVGVIVTATREGIELGSASIWAVESDSGSYFDELAREIAEQAIDEAKETLRKLCGAKQ